MRWTSGASARASVTQHGAVPVLFDVDPPFALPAWSGHSGVADAALAGVIPAIVVQAIGVPRNAPIRQ